LENTIEEIKYKIWKKAQFPVHAIRLIYNGKELEDKKKSK